MAWIGDEHGFLAIPEEEPLSSRTRSVSDGRPSAPTPEQFGLTKERLYKLEGFPDGERWFGILVITCYVLVVSVLIFRAHEKSAGNIFLAFFLGLWITGGVVVGAAVPFSIISWLRCRLSPDYPKYRSYRKAYDAWQQELMEWTRRQASWWYSLSGRSFEYAVGMVFQRRGYDVQHTGASGDGGIDLVIRKGEESAIVQCKAHNKPVGPSVVRDCYGTLLHRGAKKAIVVASHGFSGQARDFANGKPIELWDTNRLIRELSDGV